MSTACSFPDPEKLGEAGEKIYRQKYEKDFEQRYPGKVVAINLTSEQAIVGDSLEEVIARGRSVDPTSLFHVFRVGAPGVFRVPWAYAD
jgi:hypothetical protein